MKLASFSILTALSLLFAGLTLAESEMYQKWERALREQKDIQTKVAYFQRLNGLIDQLLRRMAVDSQHDPALAELLKQNQIKVVISSPDQAKDTTGAGVAPGATGGTNAAGIPNETPAAADKQAPPNSTPSHP